MEGPPAIVLPDRVSLLITDMVVSRYKYANGIALCVLSIRWACHKFPRLSIELTVELHFD